MAVKKANWIRLRYSDKYTEFGIDKTGASVPCGGIYGTRYICSSCGTVSPTGGWLPVCPSCKSLMKAGSIAESESGRKIRYVSGI